MGLQEQLLIAETELRDAQKNVGRLYEQYVKAATTMCDLQEKVSSLRQHITEQEWGYSLDGSNIKD